jgi:glucoamylase
VKLLRSVSDGRIFDFVPDVANRYLGDRKASQLIEIWKPNRQVCAVKRGYKLRIQAPAAFRLHWSADGWQTAEDTPSSSTALGIDFVDIPGRSIDRGAIRFTFLWTASQRWEGRDYVVTVVP